MRQDKMGIWPFWAGALVLPVLFLLLVSDILLPFVVGVLVAYFLDPAADRLQKLGMTRHMATLLITACFFSVVITGSALLLPVLYDQFLDILSHIPEYAEGLKEKVAPWVERLDGAAKQQVVAKLEEMAAGFSSQLLELAGGALGGLWQSGVALLNILSLIFISPVVSFYLLRDWDRMIARLDRMLPRRYAATIRRQARAIDATLSAYIRGQSNACLLLGALYALGLTLVGLEFGLFIGFATGILAFIPYVGLFIGIVTGLIVAFFQFGDLAHMGMVLGVFVMGQVLEAGFITPKIVGDKVGLHPVWIIFGLLAGGSLFGFVGVLLAVPVTAVIGVLVRFAVAKYLEGPVYVGNAKRRAAGRGAKHAA